MTAPNRFVFINCPFDAAYQEHFEAIVFTVRLSGYELVCALEDDDFGDVRLDKLKSMIERCDRSIHDLSRTESGARGMPRFNMPFELGLAIGALRYGGRRQRRKSIFVMVREPYTMPLFLSDAAGQDPHAHHGKTQNVIKLVRNHFGHYYDRNGRGARLPGAKYFCRLFDEFNSSLPDLAKKLHLSPDELKCFNGGYRDYLELVNRFAAVVRSAAVA